MTQAKALKQRNALGREGHCTATVWLTEERRITRLMQAGRKIVDWHNRLRQAAEPGRTKAKNEEEKSCPCSCWKQHRNEHHTGSKSCPQVLFPTHHPGNSSSLYTQKKQFLCHLSVLGVPTLSSGSGQKLAGGLDLTSFTAYLCASLVSCRNAHRYIY